MYILTNNETPEAKLIALGNLEKDRDFTSIEQNLLKLENVKKELTNEIAALNKSSSESTLLSTAVETKNSAETTEEAELNKISGEDVAEKEKFFKAIDRDDVGTMYDMLLTQPSLVSARNSEGNDPILMATIYGHVDVINFLLENGATSTENNGGANINYSAFPALIDEPTIGDELMEVFSRMFSPLNMNLDEQKKTNQMLYESNNLLKDIYSVPFIFEAPGSNDFITLVIPKEFTEVITGQITDFIGMLYSYFTANSTPSEHN